MLHFLSSGYRKAVKTFSLKLKISSKVTNFDGSGPKAVTGIQMKESWKQEIKSAMTFWPWGLHQEYALMGNGFFLETTLRSNCQCCLHFDCSYGVFKFTLLFCFLWSHHNSHQWRCIHSQQHPPALWKLPIISCLDFCSWGYSCTQVPRLSFKM